MPIHSGCGSWPGAGNFPEQYNARIDGYKKPGSTFKLNLALKGLPSFSCLPDHAAEYGPTIHLLPDESIVMQSLTDSFRAVQEGRLPEFPAIEWYIHSTSRSERERRRRPSQLRALCAVGAVRAEGFDVGAGGRALREAPSLDLRSLRARHERPGGGHDAAAPEIDRALLRDHSGPHPSCGQFVRIRRSAALSQPIAGLYSCSAGTHPAGSVIGCAGHNAAMCVLKDLG